MKLSVPHLPLQFHKPLLIHLTRFGKLTVPRAASHAAEIARSLQAETLEVLEWSSVCKQLSPFTSTPMGFSATDAAAIPIGKTPEESRRLIDQTAAAVAAMEALDSWKLDLSEIQDVSSIVESAAAGRLLTIRELCTVGTTLMAARTAFEKLQEAAIPVERIYPLLELYQSCDFKAELKRKIGFCIDCNLPVILDRASEDLEIIRAERSTNMRNLDSLLKEVSTRIFQSGGIDRPLVTKRRSRMCVGVRASYKHLLPDGVVLGISSSGATYFMEPEEAVELNNMEVTLANSEKAEETAILSFLSSEVSVSASDILYLLDRVLEADLAFARASYARQMNGVCPSFSSIDGKTMDSMESHHAFVVDIDAIQHPLLLGSKSKNPEDGTEFPVPIDIKVTNGTRVVVISGPNTGGKTASLKTLGLASLMSKSGMYLPARNNPRLPWFDLILADVGDQQSLEQNLSTFSGHISRICRIFEVASEESLVLLDEICSGTDPSEGVALSTSILQHLKDRVKLTVVTTHYADLSRLKDNIPEFQNAAMEFSMRTLQPTFRILWGSIGDSNALSIAKSIGFDQRIIDRAHEWVEKLRPEKQDERKGLLFMSLVDERNKLDSQARRAADLHAEVMDLYHEVQQESDDLDRREKALMDIESLKMQDELKAAKLQMQNVVDQFEKRLKTASADEYTSLLRDSEVSIASILKAHYPSDLPSSTGTYTSYSLHLGDQVRVKGLGNKIATVVEEPGENGKILVQYGKVRVRVARGNIIPILGSETKPESNRVPRSKARQGRSELQSGSEKTKTGELTYGPRIQTSKNTVDLRGMRVEEATHQLSMAISGRDSGSVLFVIHGMGTGALKECALRILGNNPRVSKYEQESPMNYGCTVAYIK